MSATVSDLSAYRRGRELRRLVLVAGVMAIAWWWWSRSSKTPEVSP